MLLPPGRHVFRRAADPHAPFVLRWASASADRPSSVRVLVGEALVEDARIGPFSPHTWWSSNPLIEEEEQPKPGGRVTVEVGEGATLRVHWNLAADDPAA